MGVEKRFTGPARLASWAPNMDVVALVTAEGQLSAFRFNWQRQWTHTCEENVTSLCWRPDGKLIVAGLADGSLSFHDAENGELLLLRKRVHASPVSVLDWNANSAVTSPKLRLAEAGSRWSDDCFPRPSDATASASSAMARLMNVDGIDRLNVLVSVDRSGGCVLSAFGVFQVAQLDLRAKLCRPPSDAAAAVTTRILCVEMTSDFSQLRILFCTAQSGPGDIAYAHIATPLLRSSALELCQIARGGHRVQLLLDSIAAAVASCVRQLGDTNTAVGDKIAEFSALLRDHGSQATASEEFMSLLITGVASAATNQFLSQALGIGGLKRLSKMVDAGLATVHSLLTDHLRPAIECLLLRMSELSGLALWAERSELTGLEREGCEQSVVLAEQLLASVAQAVVACRAAASTYRHFFLWMQRIQKRLNDEGSSTPADAPKLPFVDVDVVSAFLQSGLRADALELLLLPTSSSSLARLAHALQDRCGGVFSSVPATVSASCVCHSQHALLSRDGGADLSRMTTCGTFDYACFAPGADPEVGNELGIARHASCAHAFLEAALVRFAPGERIIDAQFYRDARLLVLVNDSSGAARLDMLNCELLSYARADATGTVAAACHGSGAVVTSATSEAVGPGVPLSMMHASAPLAVSSKRGLACAFFETTRGLLIDLEAGDEEHDG